MPDQNGLGQGGMLKMISMSKEKKDAYWKERATIRTDQEVLTTLSRVKLNLRGTKLRFRGKTMTQEAIFGALTLWAAGQDVDSLAEQLAPFVTFLENLVGGGAHEKAPDDPGGHVEGVKVRTVDRRRGKSASGGEVNSQFTGELG